MKYSLSLLFLIVSVGFLNPAGAQSEPPNLAIRQFRGVNLSTNPLLLKPGESLIAQHIDFSKNPGRLSPRDGFTVFQKGIANVLVNGQYEGVFGYYRNDGTKRLFTAFTFDSTDSNFKTNPFTLILRTNQFDNIVQTGIGVKYQYRHEKPSWLVYNDILIIANGKNRPTRYVEDNFRPLVETAPGFMDFAPMAETTVTTQLLDGDYYYYWRNTIPGDTVNLATFPHAQFIGPSFPVHVDNDWVFIFNFPEIGYSKDADAPAELNPDTTKYGIYRTRAGADWVDSVFFIGTMLIPHGGSLHFIDSLPDDSLGDANHPFVGSTIHDDRQTPDTTKHDDYKVGTPQWIGTDTTAWTGMSKGFREGDTNWVATWYAVAWYDSATNMISDTGRSIRVPVFSQSLSASANDTIRDTAIKLALPKANSDQSGFWRVLVRRQETLDKETVSDTIFSTDGQRAVYYPNGPPLELLPDLINYYPPGWYCSFPNGMIDANNTIRFSDSLGVYWCRGRGGLIAKDTIAVKTWLSEWRVIDTIKNSDSVYFDNLPWGVDFNSKPSLGLNSNFPLGQWDIPIEYSNRVWMTDGELVFFSDIAEPTRWIADNAFVLGVNDGDEVVVLYTDKLLNVFKNNSWWTIKENAIGDFTVRKFLDGIGCIAKEGVLELPGGGLVFLHTSGIYLLSNALQSLYKEVSGNLTRISDKIQPSLDSMTIEQLQTCHTWLSEDYQNLHFSFNGQNHTGADNKTYTYSLVTGDWAIWPLSPVPNQTTRYDTVFSDRIRPSRDVIFVSERQQSLYDMGGLTDNYDTSAITAFTYNWKSGPLFVNHDLVTISEYAAWKTLASGTQTFTTNILNSAGSTVETLTDSMNVNYRIYPFSMNESHFFYVNHTFTGATVEWTIQGIDLWGKFTAQAPRHNKP